ncbi:MAG: DVUA0089 family protein [Deltaproteobacteria bacterium]|nr:DVUA0089 family protein [Deltaproteobacteria bacterium]
MPKTFIGKGCARTATLACLALAFAACGDDKTNNNNSNNNNNNNPTKKITIDRFEAAPTTVATGGTVVLSWKATNASTVEISATPGGVVMAASAEVEGTMTSSALSEATTFKLTAKADGLATVEKTVTVSIDAAAVGVSLFEATPNPGELEGMTTLHWKTVNATSIRILDGTTEIHSTTTEVAEGTKMVTLDAPIKHFKLEAMGATGMATRDLEVTATGPLGIHAFTATPGSFSTASAEISVHWETTGATSVTLTQNGASVAGFSGMASGTMSVTVSDTTTFVLRATADGQTPVEETRTVSKVSGGEVEPNDTFAQATPGMGTMSAALGSDVDEDWFSVAVVAGGWLRVATDDLTGTCALDTIVEVFQSDGTTSVDRNDDRAGGETCSLVDPRRRDGVRNLAAGTYLVQVTGYEGALGDYVITIETGAKACGNGIPETGEQCDDGNTTAADGCDASCALEVAGEVTTVPANQVFDVPLASDASSQTVRLVVPQKAFLRAETYVDNAGTPDCPAPIDTLLEVVDSTQATVTGADGGGIGECSKIDPAQNSGAELEPGTYFLVVMSFEATGAPNLKLRVELLPGGCGNGILEPATETCDDGNTTAGDGCNATCRPEASMTISPPGGRFPIALPDPSSTVTFGLTIANGQSVTASVTPANGAADCDPYPRLAFLDPAFVELGDSYGDFETGCASIDATRGDAFASDLPAGTYYLFVQNLGGAAGNLQLNVVIRNAACGNGIIEARSGEQCDDGNTAVGDGCDAQCHLAGSFTQEVEPNSDAATATPSGIAGQTQVTVGGSISPANDVDWWKLTLTAQASLSAATFTNLADPASCATGTDTVVTLYDSAGTALGENDDTASGMLCSTLDATHSDPVNATQNLAAGTYYVGVRSYQGRTAIPLYFMSIRLN